jgi:hypothetical protein
MIVARMNMRCWWVARLIGRARRSMIVVRARWRAVIVMVIGRRGRGVRRGRTVRGGVATADVVMPAVPVIIGFVLR